MSRVDVRDDSRASPLRARSLLTVRAAISFARFVEAPCFFSLSLMCSYCRSRLLLQAFCGIVILLVACEEGVPEGAASYSSKLVDGLVLHVVFGGVLFHE